jgi:DNA-binding transcriptional regulator YdaS (Cro superfamily)
MDLKSFLKSTKAVYLAQDLGIPAVLISQWSHGIRRIPAERCIQIEAATGGQVRCEDMRPDINWAVLRGTGPVPTDKAA